mgnify:CR=1 FL=1
MPNKKQESNIQIKNYKAFLEGFEAFMKIFFQYNIIKNKILNLARAIDSRLLTTDLSSVASAKEGF